MTMNLKENIKIREDINNKEMSEKFNALLNKGEYLKAQEFALMLYEMAHKNWDKVRICQGEIRLGVVARLLEQYEKCKTHFLNAIRMADQLNDKRLNCFVHKEVSKYYLAKRNWDKALSHSLIALDFAKKINNPKRTFDVLNTIAGTYYERGISDKAQEYFDKAFEIAHQENIGPYIALMHYNQGYVYLLHKEYDKAVESYKKGIEKQRELNVAQKAMSLYFLGVAESYLALGNLEESYRYGKIALDAELEAVAEQGEGRNLLHVYAYMTNYHEAKENYKEALEYYKKYYELDKKLFKQNNTTKLEEMIARYEMEKKEKEAIIYELKALRAQINPHFIFNALGAIQAFIWDADNKTAVDYLARFARLIRKILDYSEVNYITIDQEIDFLTNYLEIEQMRFKDILSFDVHIDDTIDTANWEIPPMVLQPYVENAIKHGIGDLESMHVTIHLFPNDQNNRTLTVVIEDNGIGREKALKIKQAQEIAYESKGTKVTNEMLYALNAKLGVEINAQITDLVDADNKAIGTRVEIILPYKITNEVEKLVF